ncbi:MAG: autotransporter domain-containing protein [Rhodospirillaceae bacterium]|nr:autotransporter domain-containing protein [Rhodospirillaceae bacterium]
MDYYFSNPDCVAENTSKGIASLCGSTTDPGAQDGVSMNFAFGGARSGNEDLPTLATGLQTALDDLAAYNTAGVVSSTAGATFFVLTGGNDYTNYVSVGSALNEQQIVNQTLGFIQTGLEKIDALGAKRAVVLNYFDLGRVPTLVADFSAEQLAQSGRLSTLHNIGIADALAAARASTGMEIILVDLDGLYNDIYSQPALYGFTNTTGSCLNTSGDNQATGECPDTASEDATLFWEGQHPTRTAQGYIYELVVATLRAVDEDGGRLAALPDSGLTQLRTMKAAVRSEINSWRGGNPLSAESAKGGGEGGTENVGLFLIAENGAGNRAAAGDFSGYDYNTKTVIVGATAHPSDFGQRVLFGGYIGQAMLDSSINGGGTFDNDGIALGGFSGWRSGPLSLSAQASVMRLDYSNVKRNTSFSVLPVARSSTEGWGAGVEIEARFDHPVPVGEQNIKLAATGRIAGSRAEVEGFSESGASFLNLTVDSSDVSEITAGIELTAWTLLQTTGGPLRPYVTAGYERDLRDAKRVIKGQFSSGQLIQSDSRAAARNVFTISGGMHFFAYAGYQADLAISVAYGAGGEDGFVFPRLKIAKTF